MKKYLYSFLFVFLFIITFNINNIKAQKISIDETHNITLNGGNITEIDFELHQQSEIKIILNEKELKNNYVDVTLYDNNYDSIFWDVNLIPYNKEIILERGKYTLELLPKTNYMEASSYELTINDVSKCTNKIKLKEKPQNVYIGEKYSLNAISKKKGYVAQNVIWKSSNKKVARVNKNGVIKGKKEGTCTITAQVKGGNKVKCKITVKKKPPILITNFHFNKNFLNGIEPRLEIENNTNKSIKYVWLDFVFYNRVGDYAYCTIKDDYKDTIKLTGPIKSGGNRKYNNCAASIYNGTTKKIKISTAKIEYKDGTTETVELNVFGYKEQDE